MKKLNYEQMVVTQGGTTNRRCMIFGGLTTGGIVAGFFIPAFWVASFAMSGVATAQGCFD
ncbi:MAG: hypothetical protein LBH22_03280 [Bacteroidales bacterium]|nr:hypothetical protein [Bacteroidales bacterium]